MFEGLRKKVRHSLDVFKLERRMKKLAPKPAGGSGFIRGFGIGVKEKKSENRNELVKKVKNIFGYVIQAKTVKCDLLEVRKNYREEKARLEREIQVSKREMGLMKLRPELSHEQRRAVASDLIETNELKELALKMDGFIRRKRPDLSAEEHNQFMQRFIEKKIRERKVGLSREECKMKALKVINTVKEKPVSTTYAVSSRRSGVASGQSR